MKKIFFIDDDPFMHFIFEKLLIKYKENTQVNYIFDCRDTVAFLEAHKSNESSLPEFMFVDINMPNFNGWQFLNAIANFYKLFAKKITIYVISSSINPEDIRKAKNYPFVTDYITKPLARKMLDQILGQSQ